MSSRKYDVIIIGAGIGGLTCGCYLAKAGMKVLIIEQHYKVGGYCTSFDRKGYRFDAAVHCLGGLGAQGKLRELWDELELTYNLKLIRNNPLDILKIPGYCIRILNNIEETKNELQQNFPKQAKCIEKFFKDVVGQSFTKIYFTWKGKTFSDVLNYYFTDTNLKSLLTFPVATVALPASRLSAIAGISLYKNFVLDGGYYPIGGMDTIPLALEKKFLKNGGQLLKLSPVVRIENQSNRIKGIYTQHNSFSAKYYVSAIDVRTTFLKLMEKKSISLTFVHTLKQMESTKSCFLVYLGIEDMVSFEQGTNIWFCKSRRIDRVYEMVYQGKLDLKSSYIFIHINPMISSQKRAVVLFLTTPFINIDYWERNKEKIKDNMIKRSYVALPELKGKIRCIEIATPVTLEKYTGNQNGAMYGWAPTPQQVERSMLSKLPFENLFLCGHWSTESFGYGGIMKAFLSGKLTALKIVDKESRR
ncbi:MAG: NAD(P)/FAD-dependent oxidoreductase [Brevinematales bacterium]|nr:NAD(P)/FAD-dependent oxidoreductase [Brevinematales bacterium]